MPIEQFTKEELRLRPRRVDRAKFEAKTEEDIQRYKREDGIDDAFLRPVRLAPGPDVRALRKRLGMTQEQFATAFHLSVRILQGWEQRTWAPDAAGRVLLSLIDHDPKAVAALVRSMREPKANSKSVGSKKKRTKST